MRKPSSTLSPVALVVTVIVYCDSEPFVSQQSSVEHISCDLLVSDLNANYLDNAVFVVVSVYRATRMLRNMSLNLSVCWFVTRQYGAGMPKTWSVFSLSGNSVIVEQS